MAWNNRGQMSAEEILGMKPEDLRTKLDGAASKEDITAATDKIAGLEGSLAAIQASLAKLTTPPPVVDPNDAADLNDPTTQMLTDPQGFVARQTQNLAKQSAETKAQLNEMRARGAYPGAFSKYNDELMKSVNNFSLEQRAQEGFWDFHIRTFMGDKYIKGEATGSYPSLMGSGSGYSSVGAPEDQNGGLDPQVAAFLKDRGVPLDKAAQIKKNMIDNGEPVSIDTYKKAS
jgi:hypothetical protein